MQFQRFLPLLASLAALVIAAQVAFPHAAAAAPASQGVTGWQVECVECQLGFGGNTAVHSLAIDSRGRPHVALARYSLLYKWFDDGRWHTDAIESAGLETSNALLALDGMDRPHIVYFDNADQRVKYIRWDGARWLPPETLAVPQSARLKAMALDSGGRPAVLYGGPKGGLYCRFWEGDAWQDRELLRKDIKAGDGLGLAVDAAGHPHVSYAASGSSLLYARWDGQRWQYETVAAGSSIGTYAALGLDRQGRPRIAYADPGLRYAEWDGAQWRVSVAADGAGGSIAGISLALDASSQPHIAYAETSGQRLVYASRAGDTWQKSVADAESAGLLPTLSLDRDGRVYIVHQAAELGDWRITTGNLTGWQSNLLQECGNIGSDPALALDSAGLPHVAYWDRGHQMLKYARWDGREWQVLAVAPAPPYWGKALALDSQDRPRIVYRDAAADAIKLARWDGQTWLIETVAAGMWGHSFSLAIDSKDKLHFSFDSFKPQGLAYASESEAGWRFEIVDGGYSDGATSLRLDAQDHPHIAYPGATYHGVLSYAAWDGEKWVLQKVDAASGTGQYASLELDALGRPRIFYYHPGSSLVKSATLTGAGWQFETAPGELKLKGRLVLAHDSQDRLYALHSVETGTQYDPAELYLARHDAGGWQSERLATDAASTSSFSLVVDGGDQLHALFLSHARLDMLQYARSTATAALLAPIANSDGNGDFTLSWSAPAAGSAAGAGDPEGATAAGAGGGEATYRLAEYGPPLMSYQGEIYAGTDARISIIDHEGGTPCYRVLRTGTGWQAPWSVPVCVTVRPDRGPVLQVDNPKREGLAHAYGHTALWAGRRTNPLGHSRRQA